MTDPVVDNTLPHELPADEPAAIAASFLVRLHLRPIADAPSDVPTLGAVNDAITAAFPGWAATAYAERIDR